jgi:polyribonucleotide nucleotidyltransferase
MPAVSRILNGRTLSIETGTLARQASGSAVVRHGDTIVLATATIAPKPRADVDFFPLIVDFEEKMYAAGKIPGSRFIKREGRPTEHAVVTCRRIDRPLRPLFPQHLRQDVQIIITVLSADPWNPPDIAGLIGASCAVALSPIPFMGPVGAVRVGRVDGKFILNPTYQELEASDLDLVVTASRQGILMLEGSAHQLPGPVFMEAVEFGQKNLLPTIELQEEIIGEAAQAKIEAPAQEPDPEMLNAVAQYRDSVRQALQNPNKLAREDATRDIEEEVFEKLQAAWSDNPDKLKAAIAHFLNSQFREMILHEGKRPDGRQPQEIRPTSSHVGLLPQTHGSALFVRGQTQVLSTVTLGGVGEAQILDTITPEEREKRFMHHYNFPPFSVGEVRPLRGASRRDIGHSSLVESALLPVIPPEESFPYTIRVVSEVLESNGSSSMASVCASSLALMDAGVPLSAAVAGISVGLVCDDSRWTFLTDIQGIEDFAGDMDFKIAGTETGITACQLDMKKPGLPLEVLAAAVERACEARLSILEGMKQTLPAPRPELAPHAPRIFTVEIPQSKIGDVIGPGGRMVRKIEQDFNVRVDIEQEGRVFIAAHDQKSGEAAVKVVEDLTRELRIGETYIGKVVRITAFGAFVELMPGRDGLLHISEISPERIAKVEDVLHLGDEIEVKVLEIGPDGKVRLTRKGLLQGDDASSPGSRRAGRRSGSAPQQPQLPK